MAGQQEAAERLPPHNREAERGVLGSTMRDNSVIGDVVNVLRAEHFYIFAHQKIFEAICTLSVDQGKPADTVTLADYLKEKQLIDEVGGYAYLSELWDAAPSPAGAEYYAKIVRDKAIIRGVIHACTEIERDAQDQVQPADELLDSAERKILDIAQSGLTSHTVSLKEALHEAMERIDSRSRHDHPSLSGLPTGYIDLDNLTAGLQNTELAI